MSALSSKSLSDNPKPVLSFAEGSAIRNPKWLGLFAMVLTFVFGWLWPKRSSRREFTG